MVDVKGLDPRFAPSVRLSSVRFLTYTGKEVERISCKRITNPNTFDSLLHPNKGGLYDLALGPCDQQEICGTCGLNGVHCPGHMGHIPIPLPVYHPVFFSTLFALLKISCWNCCRLFCHSFRSRMLIGQLELVELGLLSEASAKLMEHEVLGDIDPEDMENPEKAIAKLSEGAVASKIRAYVERCKNEALTRGPGLKAKTKHLVEMRSILIGSFIKSSSRSAKKCPHCKAPLRSFRQENRSKIFIKGLQARSAALWRNCRITELKERRKREREFREGVVLEEDNDVEFQCPSEESLMKSSYVTPLEVRDHVARLWSNEKPLVNAIIGCCEVAKSAVGMEGAEEGVRQSMAASEDTSPADVFFLEVIPVPPSRFRPIAQLGEKRFENPQTVNLQRVLQDTIEIEQLMAERKAAQLEEEGVEQGVESEARGGAQEQGKNKKVNGGSTRKKLSFPERLQICWLKLQNNVNCLMDSTSDKTAKVAPNGIKQILEKKDGLFRKHMMGKRVDFAARSVISPDPYINMDEIGIPMVFALKLTYPQPVTDWNVEELRQAVINGPNTYPGATHVQRRDGSVVLLSSSDPLQRVSLAETLSSTSQRDMAGARQKVFRHLKNGDVLLMNRQPTLHKPSIMAHKARILPGEKTLRLHYANCKTYNADFDGDEMNAHFPQNELARAEAYTIVSTHHQYLVPKDGTPLSGLIQDHVVSGLLMTIRGNMFSRSDYMHLVFSALPDHPTSFNTLPPCMRKPQRLWSGKQVVSTLLLNIAPQGMEKLNLNSRAKIAVKEWGRGNPGVSSPSKWTRKMRRRMKYYPDSMSESEVVFCEGELMCGVLDKSQFGASQYGFVHSCHELYGGAVANMLLSALGRLFTTYLQLRGFTLGVEDILVRPEAEQERRELMAECVEHGPEATAEALGIDTPEDTELIRKQYEKAHRSTDPNAMKMLDYFMKKKTDHYNNSINAACVPVGLHKPFPSNCLQLMVQSGAKGSTVNCMQISSLLGQIELEGRRPPLMVSGRFLPSFLPYDPSPRAGGFVDGRFLSGIRPQEYFFHCMAGREGLVDTAVKTSRSGYLQRCLIKHLEGICVGYDMTVRDCDGSVVQFLYGEDGMDIAKTRFLKEQQFPFLISNYQAICQQLDPASAMAAVKDSGKALARHQSKLRKWMKRNGDPLHPNRPYYSGFLNFYEKHLPEVSAQYSLTERDPTFHRSLAELQLINMWYSMSPMMRDSYTKKFSPCPVPVNAHLPPNRYFGSIPDKMSERISTFLEKTSRSTDIASSAPLFESLVHFKCLRALAEPGEAVGLLAAQSIGEPSTQMTLNTFHFAGRGEMNVTLGIPRLREILMSASANIKTPSMDVPLLLTPEAREKGVQLKRNFTRVCLNQVLEKVEVWESIAREGRGHRHRLCTVKFSFLPYQYYKDEFVVTPEMILEHVETVFMRRLLSAIAKEIKIIKQKKSVSVQRNDEVSGAADSEEVANKEAESAGAADDNDGDDDMSDEGSDCDDDDARLLSKKQQHVSYEGPGESDDEAVVGVASAKPRDQVMSDEEVEVIGEHPKDSQQLLSDSESMEVEDASSPHEKNSGMDSSRVREVLKNGSIVKYSYDTEASEWCLVTLKIGSLDAKVMVTSVIESIASKSVVWETPHIKKGFLSESTEPGEKGLWRLKTDGVNLQELWRHEDILDLHRAYTNNIHAMANTYGIEAACKAIIKEISGVFKVYGIAVDYRHLSLIADYMTFEGSYKPFNRMGLESNSSPFQKMSFETTMQFLKSATIAGDVDPILSPSSCLVTGRVVRGGTGCFELLQKLS